LPYGAVETAPPDLLRGQSVRIGTYVVTTWLWLVMGMGVADGDGVISVYVVKAAVAGILIDAEVIEMSVTNVADACRFRS